NTNVANCATCGHACVLANATAACTAGACTIASCSAGYTNCDGAPANGCEVHTAVDTANCGTCGHACSTVNGTASCTAGACAIACRSGFGDCNNDASDGCETNLNTNVANCATCGHACVLANATPACTAGACTIASCNAGYTDCNGL